MHVVQDMQAQALWDAIAGQAEAHNEEIRNIRAAYDKELAELRSIVQGVANSAAEQRASIKQELLFQSEMKDREAKAAILQRTDVLEKEMGEMRTLVRSIESTSLERANAASSQVLREVQARFTAQDDMINANKMEIMRKNDTLHEMSAAWGQQIEALSRKDHDAATQYTQLKHSLEESNNNLARKIRDLEAIGFRQHTAAAPQGGSNPREYLGLVYGLREDLDNLRSQLNSKLSTMALPTYQPPKAYTPPPQPTVVREIVHSSAPGAMGGARMQEHYLGGGPHDAALVLWDEMQQQALSCFTPHLISRASAPLAALTWLGARPLRRNGSRSATSRSRLHPTPRCSSSSRPSGCRPSWATRQPRSRPTHRARRSRPWRFRSRSSVTTSARSMSKSTRRPCSPKLPRGTAGTVATARTPPI